MEFEAAVKLTGQLQPTTFSEVNVQLGKGQPDYSILPAFICLDINKPFGNWVFITKADK